MSKNNKQFPTRQRIDQPLLEKDKNGNVTLMCPFCKPSHPIGSENNSSCGTMVQVRAIQTVFKAKFDKRLICVKCGQGGGEVVTFQNGFVHTHNCNPDAVTLEKLPEFSKLAKFIYERGDTTKKVMEFIFGEVVIVEEVDLSGKKTGVILGHFFKRGNYGRRNQKRKHIETISN